MSVGVYSALFTSHMQTKSVFDLKWRRTDRSVDDIKLQRERLKS